MGGPADLNANYAAYGLPGNGIFTARVSLVQGTLTTPQNNATPSPLFALTNQKQDATKSQSIEVAAAADSLVSYTVPDGETTTELVRDMPRALRLELTPIGFGHQIYPGLATAKAIQLAADSANVAARITTTKIDPAQYVVGQPYAPKLKSFALEFVAGHELRMEAYQPGPTTDMVFHVHPFGATEARAAADGFLFLPDYSNEGELLVGIDGLQPPETL